MVKPILRSGAKSVSRDTFRTGGTILSDIADNSDGTPVGDIVSPHARDLIGKLMGRGLKRKARHASPKESKRAPKKPKLTTPERKYRDTFA